MLMQLSEGCSPSVLLDGSANEHSTCFFLSHFGPWRKTSGYTQKISGGDHAVESSSICSR